MASVAESNELGRRMTVAKQAALDAGKITREYFQTDFVRETKSDGSVVTVADRECEQFLRQSIENSFPDDAILGEEYGEKPGKSRYRWIFDPIDGTISFAQGVPLFGILIGVEDTETKDCPIGVIYMPALGEMVSAQRGQGCAWDRHLGLSESAPSTTGALVSEAASLEHAVMLATDFWKISDPRRRDALARLAERTRVQRTWADCYGYVLVATGRAELMLDPIMNVWDCAPLQVVMEEAGGTFTDWSGNRTIYGACGLATNGRLLKEVVEILGEKK